MNRLVLVSNVDDDDLNNYDRCFHKLIGALVIAKDREWSGRGMVRGSNSMDTLTSNLDYGSGTRSSWNLKENHRLILEEYRGC